MSLPEITIYPEGTPFVLNVHKAFEDGFVPDGNSFLRHVGIERYLFAKSLEHLLARADIELERVAEACGGLVVGHSWGLVQVGEMTPKVPASRLIPPNYNLVADVQTIEITDDIGPYVSNLKKSVNRYMSRARRPLGLRLTDMRPDQFCIGKPVGSSGKQGIYLLDIEPRFTFI